jgi:cysteine desulfurase
MAVPNPERPLPEGRAYFDHAATTPMCPAAIDAMLAHLTGDFGNPSGAHQESRRARLAVDDAREAVANSFGVDLGEVVFTSGGTEADNLAIAGTWRSHLASTDSRPVLVCAAMEHHAVLYACRALAHRTGAELREVRSGKDGLIDLDALAEACTDTVGLVSVMTVNNEIGTVQPMAEVAEVVRARAPGALLHTDAVQAVPWLDLSTITPLVDLTSISAHKFGGPKGVGALLISRDVAVDPLLHGGGQERDRRSGTPNVAGIVAMAAALAVADTGRTATGVRVRALRDRLADGLVSAVPGATETGERADRVDGSLHLRVAGVPAEALVILLDRLGVAVSAGAACSSGAVEASHVLLAMGFGADEAQSGVRFSLGSTTTAAEVDHALAVVPAAVAQLRD